MHLTHSFLRLLQSSLLGSIAWAGLNLTASAEIQATVEHNATDVASPAFHFKTICPPLRGDRAAGALFSIVDGRVDANSAGLDALHDGRTPTEEDEPGANFFFTAGGRGGRLLIDLTNQVEIKQINTYSWHPASRGPQVYSLYASDGQTNGFNSQPKAGTEPETCGWKFLAKVDTRPKDGEEGGQYAVSLADPSGPLGKFRYLLFCIDPTETTDGFGHTFYSEIDVLDANTPVVEAAAPELVGARQVLDIPGGRYQITIDTTDTPDLTDWATTNLAPVVVEWYPKLIQLLPSDGFEAPAKVSIVFSSKMQGVAATGGARVRCAARWFRQNLKGEAAGSVVHELVHVVQQYGRASVPGWVTEGIADYTRFFLYEPQTHGAGISRRALANAHYDASYRTTANFLNWASETYDAKLVPKLNALVREDKYNADVWKTLTGHTAPELADEWKQSLEKKLAAAESQSAATNAPPKQP